jgi:diguanylate cyclase (GGDEF)-like protein
LRRVLTAALQTLSLRHASLLAVAYFAADLSLNTQVLGMDGGLIFWPLNGITTALLLSRPRAAWAPILLLVGVSTALAEYLSGTDGITLVMGSAAFLPEVLLAAFVLPRFDDLEHWLRAPQLYLRFTVAVLLGPVLAAFIFAGGCRFFGTVPFWPTFADFVPSDAIGLATMMPLVLAARSVKAASLRRWTWWLQVFGVVGVTATAVILIFKSSAYPLLFILYPLLVWAEYLVGLLGSSLALCCACITAAALTADGQGPFVHSWPSAHTAVELYLAFHLITFLPISILMTERRFLMRELRAALAQATTLASIDGLTGLANRRTFDTQIRELWQFALRHQVPLGLLMIDADHFKRFNDEFGHQAGDDCLRSLAGTLKEHVRRASDVAARYGGEEFAMLLLDVPLDNVRTVGEQIRASVLDLSIAHPAPAGAGCVTISVGCASLIPQRDMAVDDLIAHADKALYRAKHDGRNRVCCAVIDTDSRPARPALSRLRDRIKMLGAGRGG